MAAIVQSNPYNCLIRKIGYSVGLESLLTRVVTLVETYASEKALSYAKWNSIITDLFNLKGEKSAEHVANFFCSINILKLYQKDVSVLYGLDILSILRRYFDDDSKYIESAKFILTMLILESDGDIFLNLLSASFDKDNSRKHLGNMIASKRHSFKKTIRNNEIAKSINKIIDIKQQKKNTSGKSTIFDNRSDSPFEKRKEPLLGVATDEVIISEDYLRKVPQTRKAWATDLGLFHNNKITDSGHNLLAGFKKLNLGLDNCAFAFWPYKEELATLLIKPDEIGIPSISKWDILSQLALIKNKITVCDLASHDDSEDIIKLISTIYILYKEGDRNKGIIRHQLPLYVLYPVIIAIKFANNECVPNIPQILENEYRSRERRINKINITGTEGAVIIR